MDSTLQSSLQPLSPERIEAGWDAYRQSLGQMNNDQLLQRLTEINAQMQQQATTTLGTAVTEMLRASLASIDRPVLSSTPTPSPSLPVDRGAPRSTSPQPTALDLLARSRSLAPRVASKLLLAQLRAGRR